MTNTVSKTIQVTSVFPGRLGGAIVKGAVVGECAELRCKIDWRVAINLPRPGEFWQMTGRHCDHELYGPQLYVSACQPVKLPDERYIASLLARHPSFAGFCFGPKKITALLDEFGHVELVKHLNEGNVYVLSKVIQPAIASEVVKSWQSLNNEVEARQLESRQKQGELSLCELLKTGRRFTF